jgi:hypothetical protein
MRLTRVRVARHRAHGEFDVADAAHAQHHLWPALAIHPAELPDAGVTGEQITVPLHKRLQIGTANLFLTLHQKLHPAGQASRHRAHRPHRGDPRDQLSLVVRDTARVEPAVAHLRIKRRRIPQIQWLRRLHIIVVVAEQRLCGGTGCSLGVGVDDGETVSGHHLGGEARAHQQLAHEICRLLDAFTAAGYARNATDPVEVFQKLGQMLLNVAVDLGERSSHGDVLLLLERAT